MGLPKEIIQEALLLTSLVETKGVLVETAGKIVEVLGQRALLLEKHQPNLKEHEYILTNNKLYGYDLYYVDTTPEQAERVRIVELSSVEEEGYYGTIIVKKQVPGVGSPAGEEGSIIFNVADINKVRHDGDIMKITIQNMIEYYSNSFIIPSYTDIVDCLRSHGKENPHHVYYGSEGVTATASDKEKAVNLVCKIFDLIKASNPIIDPTTQHLPSE